jgi:hypothetical protein
VAGGRPPSLLFLEISSSFLPPPYSDPKSTLRFETDKVLRSLISFFFFFFFCGGRRGLELGFELKA